MLSPRAHLQHSIAALLEDMTHTKRTAHLEAAPQKQNPDREVESLTTPSTSNNDGEPFYDANLHQEEGSTSQLSGEGREEGEIPEEAQEEETVTEPHRSKGKKKKKPQVVPEEEEDLPSMPKKRRKRTKVKNMTPPNPVKSPRRGSLIMLKRKLLHPRKERKAKKRKWMSPPPMDPLHRRQGPSKAESA